MLYANHQGCCFAVFISKYFLNDLLALLIVTARAKDQMSKFLSLQEPVFMFSILVSSCLLLDQKNGNDICIIVLYLTSSFFRFSNLLVLLGFLLDSHIL